MKLFEFNLYINETYPEECNKIWDYLNDVGKVHFERKNLEGLWRDFSDERFSAGFIIPTDENMKEFAYWLQSK